MQSLSRLEEVVAEVSRRLSELGSENDALRARNQGLQERIEQLEQLHHDGGWREERAAVIGRVERLVGALDELIDATDA